MPGRLIRANCNCGYNELLLPGHGINKERVMAYSKQGYELETFSIDDAKNYDLKIVADPFGKHSWNYTGKNFYPIQCPKCKSNSLILEALGHWD